MRMLENRLIIHYVPQALRRTSAGKIFSYFPHRLEVRRNRNLRWLLATFGQSKVTRRQAKPDHLMRHEKKEIAPHATREREPPHSQEAAETTVWVVGSPMGLPYENRAASEVSPQPMSTPASFARGRKKPQ